MAAKLIQELQNEIVCGICRHYYNKPVTINCGHSFCQECFIQNWESDAMSFSCPKCKHVYRFRNFPGINVRLGAMTDNIKMLGWHYLCYLEGQGQCPIHHKFFKLFCEDDQIPLCVVCSQAQEHQAHKLCPIEKATQNNMANLKEEEDKAKAPKEEEDKAKAPEGEETDKALEEEGRSQCSQVSDLVSNTAT